MTDLNALLLETGSYLLLEDGSSHLQLDSPIAGCLPTMQQMNNQYLRKREKLLKTKKHQKLALFPRFTTWFMLLPSTFTNFLLLEDGTSRLLQEDGSSRIILDVHQAFAYLPKMPDILRQYLAKWKRIKIITKHRKFSQFPEFQTWLQILPFVIPPIPPMLPYLYKQLQPLWKRRTAVKKHKVLIKTFLITNLIDLLNPIYGSAIGDTNKQKQIISTIKRKILNRRRLNLKYGTPKYQTWQPVIPPLSPSTFTAAIQPWIYRRFIPKWIKKKTQLRRISLFKKAPQFQAWFMVFLELRVAEIQPWIYKQFIGKWKKKKLADKHRKISSFPQFQAWNQILPALSPTKFVAAIQPDRFKQILPKIRRKILAKRKLPMKYGTPKYQAWFATNPALSPSVWAAAVQPYLLKQLIPILKRRLAVKKRFNAKYGTPKFVAWFKVIPKYIPFASVIQPYGYLTFFARFKQRYYANKRRRIAQSGRRTDKMDAWYANIRENIQVTVLTVINTLIETLRVTK